MTPRLPDLFYVALEQELNACPNGISEYDLIKTLRSRGFFDFLPKPPAQPRELFRAHFLLFHALYQLADRLSSAQQGRLQIDTLCIRRMPWSPGDSALTDPDNLRAYYLDWSHFDGTTDDDVRELLDSFWRRLARCNNRADALSELGLEDPVDDEAIKLAWRRLAMKHHPDRGGDKTRFQAINAAVDRLIR